MKRNFFFSALSAVLGILYPLVAMAYVARALGPEALGKYYFANSLAAYFLFAASFGIPVYGNREIARARGDSEALGKVFGELFLIGLVATAVAGLVFAGAVFAVPSFRAEALLMGIFGLLFVVNAFSIDYVYAGLERQDWILYRSAASKAISIVLIVVFVRSPDDYLAFGAVTVATAALNALMTLGGFRHASLRRPFSLNPGRHLKPLLHIMGSLLFLNVYLLLDSVILGLFAGPHEVGLYGSVVKPCRTISLLASTLAAAALPRLMRQSDAKDAGASRDLQRKSFELLSFVTIPAFLAAVVAAPRIVAMISGAEFAEAASTLRFAAPLILTNSLAAFATYQILLPFGKERLYLAASALLAVVNAGFNFALVPFLGREGAVISALAAEAAFLILIFVALRKENVLEALRTSNLWKYWAAGALSAGVLYAGGGGRAEAPLAFLPVCLAAALVYAGALWAMREPVTRQSVGLIRSRLFRSA